MRFWTTALVGLCAVLMGGAWSSAGILGGAGWRWEERIDPVTDEVSHTAIVFSSFDITGRDPLAFLSLHCFRQTPAIYVGWDAKVITKKHWRLEYRFAGQPGHTLSAQYVNRSEQIVADLDDVRRFLAEARQSVSLYVRL